MLVFKRPKVFITQDSGCNIFSFSMQQKKPITKHSTVKKINSICYKCKTRLDYIKIARLLDVYLIHMEPISYHYV